MLLARLEADVQGSVDAATTVTGVAVVGAGAKVTASRLIGPVCIGADCVVDASTIGPDVSIEPGSTIRDSTIRDSIVMAGSSVDGVDALEASILGRNADVRHAGGRGAHRLVVGDQSRVEVD
jgi:glucose-1-phosphate thymidylyltransferase